MTKPGEIIEVETLPGEKIQDAAIRLGILPRPEKYGMRLDEEIVHRWRAAHDFYKIGDTESALDLYRALRRDHGVELFYEIEPPANIRFIHPIGAVLGRATYSSHMVIYQGSGVGSDLDGGRPTFTGPCCLFPGARVLGKTTIGSNVFIQANVVVNGGEVPDNSVVYAHAPEWRKLGGSILSYDYKPTKRSVIESFFK